MVGNYLQDPLCVYFDGKFQNAWKQLNLIYSGLFLQKAFIPAVG